jgi:hypothetical protein
MGKRASVLVAVAALALAAALAIGRAQTAPPPGATARCRDGTYSFSQHRSGTCSHHGGVAVWLTGSGSSSGGGSAASSCGVERRTVKTLQDRPPLLPLQRVTIAYLVSRP